MKKLLFSLFIIIFASISLFTAYADKDEGALSDDIVILYTSDIHAHIDSPLSYDVLSAIKKDLQTKYKYVFLVDAGDHLYGTPYGSFDKGDTVSSLMEMAGYDAVTPGVLDFGYGIDRLLEINSKTSFPYISSSVYKAEGDKAVNCLDGYAIFDIDDTKIAFVGLTSGVSYTSSGSAFLEGEDFILSAQGAIDTARGEGATIVIGLGHMGLDSSTLTSAYAINNLSGLTAFIDGSDHNTLLNEIVKDKNKSSVLLTQAGEYFNNIGMMVISAETGEIKTDLIKCENKTSASGEILNEYKLTSKLYSKSTLPCDTDIKETKDAWIWQVKSQLENKIGSTEINFENQNSLSYNQEIALGNLTSDSLYYLFDKMGIDCDLSLIASGCLDKGILAGDITYSVLKEAISGSYTVCLRTVTGQQLLDMLEWSCRLVGDNGNNGFLQVSGVRFKVNTAILNTTQSSVGGAWTSGPEKYRVYDVEIFNKDLSVWESLSLGKSYNIASYDYILKDLGYGYGMLKDTQNVLSFVDLDYMVLADYIKDFENGAITKAGSPLNKKYPSLSIDYSQAGSRIVISKNEIKDEPKMQGQKIDLVSVLITAVVIITAGGSLAYWFFKNYRQKNDKRN